MTATPPLSVYKASVGPAGLRVAGLVAVNAVLLIAIAATAYGVRAARLEAATKNLAAAKPFVADQNQVQEEVDVLDYENERQRSVLDVFQALAKALPPGIELTTLNINSKGEVTIVGRTPSVEVASLKAMAAIRDSAILANPKFLGASQEKEGTVFRITCELKSKAGGPGP